MSIGLAAQGHKVVRLNGILSELRSKNIPLALLIRMRRVFDGADYVGTARQNLEELVMDDNRFSFDDPLRPVDFRSRATETLLRTGRFPSPRRYDQATCEIAAYLRLRRDNGLATNRSHDLRRSGLHDAFALYNMGHPRLRAAIEAMLLTDTSVDAVSSNVGLNPSCIEWYEAAFFDVRARLRCPHFILHQVIEEGRDRSGGHWCSWGWKLAAYLGGREVLEEAMGMRQIPTLEALMPVLRRETQVILQVKAARLVSDLPAEDAAALTKLLHAFEMTGQSSAEPAPNAYEDNVKEMMKSIPWSIGALNASTPLSDFETCPAEARADEMLLMGMGRELPYAEALLAKKFPRPAVNAAE